MHYYRIFGLTVASEVLFTGLRPAALPQSSADITICCQHLPSPAPLHNTGFATLTPQHTVFVLPHGGQVVIRDGTSIIFSPPNFPLAAEALRSLLLGTALNMALTQRGLFLLHASAVSCAGRALAFLGASGAGKSTLVQFLLRRGEDFLTDDCLALELATPIRAYPSFGLAKLWTDALMAAGQQPENYVKVYADEDKYLLPVPVLEHSVPLHAIYILERSDDPAALQPEIEQVAGYDAFQLLFPHTYAGMFTYAYGQDFLSGIGEQHYLHRLGWLLNQIPVFRLRRVWDLSLLPAVAAFIEQHTDTVLSA